MATAAVCFQLRPQQQCPSTPCAFDPAQVTKVEKAFSRVLKNMIAIHKASCNMMSTQEKLGPKEAQCLDLRWEGFGVCHPCTRMCEKVKVEG